MEINLTEEELITVELQDEEQIDVELMDTYYIPGFIEAEEQRRTNELERIANEEAREKYCEEMKEKLGDLDEGVMFTDSNDTITGKKTFNTLPETIVEPTNGNQLVNKRYVDDELTRYYKKDEPMGDIVVSDIECKNLFNKNNTNILEGIIDTSTGKIVSSSGRKTLYIPCETNTTYTISKLVTSRFIVAYTTEKPAFGVSFSSAKVNNEATSITYTTGADAKYLCVFFYHSTYDTSITVQDVLNSMQIEKGNIATEYTDYKKYGYNSNESMGSIVVDDIECKNLFDKNSGNVLEGFTDTSVNKLVYYSGAYTLYIPCKPNTTYTISKIVTSRFVVAYTTQSPAYNVPFFNRNGDNGAKTFTYTTGADAKYLCVFFYNKAFDSAMTTQYVLDTVQIEKGDVATDFAEHKEIGIKDAGLIAFENYGYYRKYGKIVFIELMKYGLSLTLNANTSVKLGYLPSNCLPRWNYIVPVIATLTGGTYNFNCVLIINYTTGLVTIENKGTSNLTVYGMCVNTSYMVDNDETPDVATASEVSTLSLEEE